MTITIAPSTEACQAIVARLNDGTGEFTLARAATYARNKTTEFESVTGLEVDVIHVDEEQLNDTFELEGRTSHKIEVWIRKKLTTADETDIDALSLIVFQIWRHLNNYDSSGRRVRVWECGIPNAENPNKDLLRRLNLFSAKLELLVKVEPPA